MSLKDCCVDCEFLPFCSDEPFGEPNRVGEPEEKVPNAPRDLGGLPIGDVGDGERGRAENDVVA